MGNPERYITMVPSRFGYKFYTHSCYGWGRSRAPLWRLTLGGVKRYARKHGYERA